jgi:hypothetical protein
MTGGRQAAPMTISFPFSLVRWVLITGTLLLVAAGCTVVKPHHTSEEKPDVQPSGSVRADAYLFDTEIVKAGKLTSMRLEIFDADSVMAVAGRAYLGKGAVRGKFTADSIIMYFPPIKQYLRESVRAWHSKDSCVSDVSHINFLRCLDEIPGERSGDSGLAVRTVSRTEDNVSVAVTSLNCRWVLSLTYFLTSQDGWRLSRFVFDDSTNTTISGNRREFRPGAKFKASQFDVVIPDGAESIIP